MYSAFLMHHLYVHVLIVKVIGELISCFFATQRTLLHCKSPELLWSCSQVHSHVPITPHCVPVSCMPSTWIWHFFSVKSMYAFYLVFPRHFRPWFHDPHGMTTTLIAICCQPHVWGRLDWLGKLGGRVWMKNMVGWRGRRDKLLRLLSASKLLVEGGGGKLRVCVFLEITSVQPVTHSYNFKRDVCIVRCFLHSIATDDRFEPYWYREILLGVFIAR